MTEGDSDLSPAARLHNKGQTAFADADYSRALECFRKAIELDEHYKTWEMIGASMLALGDAEGALLGLRRAFEMNPRSSKTGHRLASCMHSLGMPIEEVDDVLRQVLVVNETYGPAIRLREVVRRRQS
tara:strand:+ start:30265 stop:30648 length:384 start_codon:yes stop_codon:yes gene_type:complete